MLTFTDSLAAGSVYQLGTARPVYGTLMLGSEFGTIERAALVRNGERVEIKNDAGELLLLLLANPGWTASFECLFDAAVSAPHLLQTVVLPMIGVSGRVMEDVSVTWEGDSERRIQIPVSQWDVMSAAVAYRLDASGTLVSIT